MVLGLVGKMLGGKAKEAVNQFSGNQDFLEGLCAISALAAAAEGGIDDNEFDTAINVIKSNSAISSSFNPSQIESVFGRMAPKTNTRSGKSELKTEIMEVINRDKTGKMGTTLLLVALDVADSGGISTKEETVLRELATMMGVNYDKLAA